MTPIPRCGLLQLFRDLPSDFVILSWEWVPFCSQSCQSRLPPARSGHTDTKSASQRLLLASTFHWGVSRTEPAWKLEGWYSSRDPMTIESRPTIATVVGAGCEKWLRVHSYVRWKRKLVEDTRHKTTLFIHCGNEMVCHETYLYEHIHIRKCTNDSYSHSSNSLTFTPKHWFLHFTPLRRPCIPCRCVLRLFACLLIVCPNGR